MIPSPPSMPPGPSRSLVSNSSDQNPVLLPSSSGHGSLLIVTGDDYGASSDVNRAIIESHVHGILTSASLLVNAPAFEEGVELARATPTLAVGLHLALSLSRATLTCRDIPALVDANGFFAPSPVQAGWRYFFCRNARAQLEREMRAQFEKYISTGLTLDHVDGHQHLHLHPTVFPMLVRLCHEYRVPAIRVLRENLALNVRIDPSRLGPKLALSMMFSLLSARALRVLDTSPLRMADRVLGLLQDGRMGAEHLRALLPCLPSGVTEIYCHPSMASGSRREFEALIDPEIRASLDTLGIHRTSYRELP